MELPPIDGILVSLLRFLISKILDQPFRVANFHKIWKIMSHDETSCKIASPWQSPTDASGGN